MQDLFSIVMSPLLRAFFGLLGSSTGVWIRFEKIRGDWFRYKVYLDQVSLQISDHLTCSAEACTLEFSILDFSLNTLIVSNVSLEGARIEYTRVANQDLIPRSLPPFLIRNLTVKDGVVLFTDQTRVTPSALKLNIENYHCEALHSQRLIFDSIFTALAAGEIDQAPFAMAYHEEGQKCISQCTITDLPMRVLTPFAEGKLDLIKESAMNLKVTTEWMAEQDEINLSVQVLITDLVNFDLPGIIPASTKMLADAFSLLINHQLKEIPIAFQFKARKDDFMDLARIDTARILTAFADALTQAIKDKSFQNVDQLRDIGKLGLGTLIDIKNLFDKY